MILVFKIILFGSSLLYTYYCFFVFPEKFKLHILYLFLMAYAGALIYGAIAIGIFFLLREMGVMTEISWDTDQLFKKGLMCVASPPFFAFGASIWKVMTEGLVAFHESHNKQNINRNPVKLFRDNKLTIQKIGVYFFFFVTIYITFAIVFIAKMG